MKTRYVSGIWCNGCQEEKYSSDTCPKCGATHLNSKLRVFAVLKQEWVERKRIWWNPVSWSGGCWKTVGLHSER